MFAKKIIIPIFCLFFISACASNSVEKKIGLSEGITKKVSNSAEKEKIKYYAELCDVHLNLLSGEKEYYSKINACLNDTIEFLEIEIEND